MSVLQVREVRPRSRQGTKTGVVSYLEKDDLDKLDFCAKRANTNRSDIVRQAIRHLHEQVMRELRGGAA